MNEVIILGSEGFIDEYVIITCGKETTMKSKLVLQNIDYNLFFKKKTIQREYYSIS